MTKSTLDAQQLWLERAMAEQPVNPANWYSDIRANFFQNPINHQSLRLTSIGFTWFTKHGKLASYTVELTDTIKPKQMLQLERLIKVPYYIKQLKVLHIFGQEDAVMLQLHNGDLNTYLDNLEDNK